VPGCHCGRHRPSLPSGCDRGGGSVLTWVKVEPWHGRSEVRRLRRARDVRDRNGVLTRTSPVDSDHRTTGDGPDGRRLPPHPVVIVTTAHRPGKLCRTPTSWPLALGQADPSAPWDGGDRFHVSVTRRDCPAGNTAAICRYLGELGPALAQQGAGRSQGGGSTTVAEGLATLATHHRQGTLKRKHHRRTHWGQAVLSFGPSCVADGDRG